MSIDPKWPKFEMAGLTLEMEVWRLISRFGPEKVKLAIKEATKKKRGRAEEKDWPELREDVEADVRDWLSGEDPFEKRTNYSIAKRFADRNAGQSASSTHKRIERKLKKKPFDRKWMMLVSARTQTETSHPFKFHLKALRELIDHTEGEAHEMWTDTLTLAEAHMNNYEAKFGEPPDSEMSITEVRNAAQNDLAQIARLHSNRKTGGLFGKSAQKKD